MRELISITQSTINDASIQTVNARELHTFLEVATAFKDWFARRIADYGFEDGKDFCSFLSESSGGRPSKEYAVSLDMAKELAMVERNEKGKQARQYFIECERQAKRDPVELLNDPSAMRGLLLSYSEKVLKLQQAVEAQAPKVAGYDRIATSDGGMCITNAAKALQQRPKDVFSWMQSSGWIYKRAGSSSYTAYQGRIQQGYLEHKVTTIERSDGSEKTVAQVLVTPKGLAKLSEIFGVALAA